jgi:hypothetical protein
MPTAVARISRIAESILPENRIPGEHPLLPQEILRGALELISLNLAAPAGIH